VARSDRYVVQNKAGGWDVVKEGHRRPTASAGTRREAVARARALARREGGGEVRVMNRSGKIVESSTVRRSRSRTTT
jgi:hypothetical protein